MMPRISVALAAFSLLMGGLSWADVAARGEKKSIDDVLFAQRVSYVDQQLLFRVDSPRGWYGAPQAFDGSGNPLYSAFPRKAVILYLKNYGKRLRGFNPFFVVKIWRNMEETPSLGALKDYAHLALKLSSPKDFLTPPVEISLGDKTWAVAEYNIAADVRGKPLRCTGKIYCLVYKNSIILIEGTDTEESYPASVALFDESVFNMRWGETLEALTSESPTLSS